jgi:formyl-CoA transferase
MMALHARQRSGRGQVVDAAIYESVLTVMENLITEYDLSGYVRERSGAILPGIAPSNVYPTRSGELILIGANQDTLFKRLCDAMGRPELATDARYRDHAARGRSQLQLDATIAGWTVEHDIEDLLPLLEEAGLAVGRVYRAPDMLKDPQFAARQSIVEVAHPVFGTVKMQNAFPRLSDTPGGVRWPGPALGEHTDAVLRDVAKLSDEAIAGLRAKGVV